MKHAHSSSLFQYEICPAALLNFEVLPFPARALDSDIIPEEEMHTLLDYGCLNEERHPRGAMGVMFSRPHKAKKTRFNRVSLYCIFIVTVADFGSIFLVVPRRLEHPRPGGVREGSPACQKHRQICHLASYSTPTHTRVQPSPGSQCVSGTSNLQCHQTLSTTTLYRASPAPTSRRIKTFTPHERNLISRVYCMRTTDLYEDDSVLVTEWSIMSIRVSFFFVGYCVIRREEK